MSPDAAIQAVLRAEASLWRNIANWYRYGDRPGNGVRYWVLKAPEVKRLESVMERFYGSLPSGYIEQAERFPQYRSFM